MPRYYLGTADLKTCNLHSTLGKGLNDAFCYQYRITSKPTKWILMVVLHGITVIKKLKMTVKYFSDKF
jgi:hypothetical protein